MLVGIDWSITSPAWTFKLDDYIEFHHFGNKTVKDERFKYHSYPSFASNTERYVRLSEIFVNSLKETYNRWYQFSSIRIEPLIFIEGYSYAAHGLVFNIAESTGILKAAIYRYFDKEPKTVPSSQWKKAHGLKGNAVKKDVIDYFNNKFHMSLYNLFGVKETNKKYDTINDIADSYCVATWEAP